MNAKDELLRAISHANRLYDLSLTPRCAYIYRELDFGEKNNSLLQVDYSPGEWEDFLNSLNYVYDSGYGLQEVYGTLWFTDGTWLERYEYDGSECWAYKRAPEIPNDCYRPTV